MDHYSNLGVDKNASDEDIKKSYRKKASKHHPDRGGDSETFQKIQRAYMVLSDAPRRERYDASGGQDDRGAQPNLVLAEARTALAQQFSAVLDASLKNVTQVDIVDAIQQNILKNRQAFQQQIAQQTMVRQATKEAGERLSNSSEDGDFVPVFENVLAENLRRIDMNIKQMEHNIEVSLVMTELLENYAYRKDAVVETVFYGTGTTSTF